MPSLFVFLIKINAVLLLFAMAYFLVLRRLTFYTINRYFLLAGIVFSSFYPFIDLTEIFAKQSQINADLLPVIYSGGAFIDNGNTLYWTLLSLIIYAGMVLLLARFLTQLISLFRVHQNSFSGTVNDNQVRILNEKMNPFSFWNTIYINPALHAPSDLQTIVDHEKVHVKQRHTIDIILSELSVIIYWFNPGVWFIKKAIKENIEFIADAEVLKNGIPKKSYQYDLLKVETGHSSLALVNTFNISGLKKRIQMMNVKPSSSYKLVTYFILLPVVILFALSFTISKRKISSDRILQVSVIHSIVRIHPDSIKIPTKSTSSPNFKVEESTLTKVENVNTSQEENATEPGDTGPVLASATLTKDEGIDRKRMKVISVRELSARIFARDTLPKTIRGVGKITESNAGVAIEKKEGDENKITFNQNNSKPVISMSRDYIRNMGSVKKKKYYLNGKEISQSELRIRLKPKEIEGITVNTSDSAGGI